MQPRLLVLALSLVILVGCDHIGSIGSHSVVGTGPDKTDARSVGAFTKVQLRNAIVGTITVDGKCSVEIQAKESLLPLVKTHVEGGELIVETTESIDSSTPVKVVIHVASLDELRTTGASSADVSGLKSEGFTLAGSGASRISLSGDAKKLTAEASGASEINLKGAFPDASLKAGGASNIHSEDAQIGSVKADATGASTIRLGAVKSLAAVAAGASTIKYQGKPNISSSESSGASTISGS